MVEVCFHMLYVLSLHLCAGGPATLERDLCPGSDGGMGGDKRDTAARPPLGGDNWVWNSRGSVDSLQTARTPCLPGLLCFVVLLSFFFLSLHRPGMEPRTLQERSYDEEYKSHAALFSSSNAPSPPKGNGFWRCVL